MRIRVHTAMCILVDQGRIYRNLSCLMIELAEDNNLREEIME